MFTSDRVAVGLEASCGGVSRMSKMRSALAALSMLAWNCVPSERSGK